MKALVEYGWPRWEARPALTFQQMDELHALEWEVEADEVPTVMLDPHQLIPTQERVDSEAVDNLAEVEYTPAIIVLQVGPRLYIYDGHHRATRARLDNCLVRAVIYVVQSVVERNTHA